MKFTKILLLLLSMLLLTACTVADGDDISGGALEEDKSSGTSDEKVPSAGTNDENSGGASDTLTRQEAEFTMTARVDKIGDVIEVTVIEAPNENTGVFWVLTSDVTVYLGIDGGEITKSDIAIGDTVKIGWGGQVMMSYPPRISALEIAILEKAK